MKKFILAAFAAVAALGFSACNQASNATATADKASKGGDKDVLYSGILPAADAQGTVYTLVLEFDDDNNYTDGDYSLVENSLVADTVAASGLSEAATSYTKGDFKKATKTVDGAEVEYIQLMPDAKDALGAASGASMYFVVNADGSLTMTGEDLVKSEMPGMNYTLTVK